MGIFSTYRQIVINYVHIIIISLLINDIILNRHELEDAF